jgi:hypothetical protein
VLEEMFEEFCVFYDLCGSNALTFFEMGEELILSDATEF